MITPNKKAGTAKKPKKRTDKTFPCFIGTNRNEWFVNKFTSTTDTTKVGHHIVHYHQHKGEREPKQPIEDIVHNIFHLSDR